MPTRIDLGFTVLAYVPMGCRPGLGTAVQARKEGPGEPDPSFKKRVLSE